MKLFEWLKCAYILFVVCVLKWSVFVEGDYIFTIQLRSYSNPENRLASGTCCGDSEEAGMCSTPCNTTLRLCFRNTNQARDDPDCPILEIIGDADPRGLNPSIQGPWPGVVQLHISVTSTNAELIDNFFIELNITANDPLSPAQEYSGENRTAVLQLQFQVTCAFNYFGLDCNTFCLDRNDTAAHFTCGDSGEIVCLPGYQNESSNCTQCAPAEGCSPAGGFCVQPGECRCQPGYSGENCAIGPILTSTPTVAPSSTLMPSLMTIISGTTSFSSTTTLLSTDMSRIASTTSAVHGTSVLSGDSSSHTDVLLITATSILLQSSIAAPEVSSSLTVDMNMVASTSTASAIHGTSIPSGGSSSHTDVILITAMGILLQSSTVTPENLPTPSSTSSPTTQSPVASPFITPGVGTVRREDSPSLVLLIVGLTVGGGLLILLSAVIFLIALAIFLNRKKREPKWRKYIYETADTTREEAMSPRYIDHSSEHFNGSPAYALLAHAVANLDQPPPNRNSLPDPTYSTFQEDREDTASGQETCMTSTTELWDESEDCPMVAGTHSEDTDPNQCSAEGIYADEEKFDLSLHQTPDSREEDSDIDLPVIGNPGATLADDAASSRDDHLLAAEESANGDPKAKDLVYAELDHQPTHFQQQDNTGQMTVHQTMQGPTSPMVTYVDVLHNADDQSEAKTEQTQMTIKSLV